MGSLSIPSEKTPHILFTGRAALRELYARLLGHATLCLRAEDVLTFPGRKLHGGFTGEILNEWKRRGAGAQVKHLTDVSHPITRERA